ncbi:MAG: metallophosphoesterase family protein [Promethearchaeota archaeon]
MIKIGLLSDTHIPTRARELPDKLFDTFRDVNYIIHAGDYVNLSVIKDLQKIAPVIGCHGNMDPSSIIQRLPKIATLIVEEKIIKIIHNLKNRSYIKKIQKMGPVDIIIHGHTHKSSVQKGDLLVINPGSATNSLYMPNSIGILYLTPDQHDYNLIELK